MSIDHIEGKAREAVMIEDIAVCEGPGRAGELDQNAEEEEGLV